MTTDSRLLRERAKQARGHVRANIKILLAVNETPAKALAVALGLSESRLSERLAGKTRFSAEEIAMAAMFFDVNEGILYRDPASLRDLLFRSSTWDAERAAA